MQELSFLTISMLFFWESAHQKLKLYTIAKKLLKSLKYDYYKEFLISQDILTDIVKVLLPLKPTQKNLQVLSQLELLIKIYLAPSLGFPALSPFYFLLPPIFSVYFYLLKLLPFRHSKKRHLFLLTLLLQ